MLKHGNAFGLDFKLYKKKIASKKRISGAIDKREVSLRNELKKQGMLDMATEYIVICFKDNTKV